MATGEPRMPGAVSLPPRSALPRDVEVPVLPGPGRTWYDRGGDYWARRVGLAQFGYVLAVLAAAVVFLFCPALILALFLMSLLPETLPERQARLWMAGRLRDHSRGAPGPDSVTR